MVDTKSIRDRLKQKEQREKEREAGSIGQCFFIVPYCPFNKQIRNK